MAGPLALLGEALASGTADYANLKLEEKRHARDRAERIEDRNAARALALEDRGAEWQREDAQYERRRLDAITTQLVKDGFLSIKDAANPEAVQAALNNAGPDYQRAVQELAEYKAAVPGLLQSSRGKADGIQAVLAMGPAQIAEARKLMNDAFSKVAGEMQSDQTKKDSNANQGAMLMTAALGRLTELEGSYGQLEAEHERLSNRQLTPEELSQVRAAAMAKFPDYKPKDKPLLDAEVAKQTEELVMLKSMQLQQRARTIRAEQDSVRTRLEAVKIAMQTGAAGQMKLDAPAALGGPTAAVAPAPASAQPALAGSNDAAAFAASLGGMPLPTSAPQASAPAAPVLDRPAAFGDYINLGVTPQQAVAAMKADAMPHRFNPPAGPNPGMPTAQLETERALTALGVADKERKERAVLDAFLALPRSEQMRVDPVLFRKLNPVMFEPRW